MDLANCTPAIFMLAAAPGSGKSYAIRWLVYELWRRKAFDYGIVFCPTMHNGAYDFMPKNVYPMFNTYRYREDKDQPYEYRNRELDAMIQHQENNRKARAFLIFDDCLGSVPWSSKQITSLISTYRHLRVTIFIAAQYTNTIPPIIRECSKYAIVFNQFQKRSIEAIHQSFFPHLDEKELRRWLQQYCRDYHFLLVDMGKGDPKERYKVSKAGRIPSFKLQF